MFINLQSLVALISSYFLACMSLHEFTQRQVPCKITIYLWKMKNSPQIFGLALSKNPEQHQWYLHFNFASSSTYATLYPTTPMIEYIFLLSPKTLRNEIVHTSVAVFLIRIKKQQILIENHVSLVIGISGFVKYKIFSFLM